MKAITFVALRIWAIMPRYILQMLGTLVGTIHHLSNSRASRVTAVNLELCSQNQSLKLQSLRETGKTMLETPAVWLGMRSRIDGWLGDVHGETVLRDTVLEGRGLLILLPHLGNWELFNVFYRRYGTMTALYRPSRSPVFNEVMRTVREKHGNEMVPANRWGIRRLYKVLGEGGTVVVLPDQVPTNGQFVPFFGADALTDELAIRLQKKTRAKVLMLVFIRRTDGYFDVHVTEAGNEFYEKDTLSALKALNGMVERAIELEPAQYQWEYKRFRERPRGATKIYRFNKPMGIHD